MKIIVDSKIPYIKEAVQRIVDEIIYAPRKDSTPELVRNADALIIRTHTHCNRDLLEGNRVEFIAAATIGFDRIDTEYYKQASIEWTNAPGYNSASVAQYIQSSPLVWKSVRNKRLDELTTGIIGVGSVGSKVTKVTQDFGIRALLNGLPREEKEGAERPFLPEKIVEECDIITFHVPLYREGEYKTFYLVDEVLFQSLKRKPVIISTPWGEVIQTDALLKALDSRMIPDAIIGAWEHEPEVNRDLLEKTFIGAPHIASYSTDGKANAIRMSLNTIRNFFQVKGGYEVNAPAPVSPIIRTRSHEEAVLQVYNPTEDSNRLKNQPGLFETLRGDHPLQREEKAYIIKY